VDEPLDATKCGGKGNCHGEQQPCITHDLWMGLNESILDYLQAVTLQQLVDDSHNKRTTKLPSISLKKTIKPREGRGIAMPCPAAVDLNASGMAHPAINHVDSSVPGG